MTPPGKFLNWLNHRLGGSAWTVMGRAGDLHEILDQPRIFEDKFWISAEVLFHSARLGLFRKPGAWLRCPGHTWGICTRRAGKLYKARSRLYRSQILQVNTRWKALAEIYTMHSFAPLWNRIPNNRSLISKFSIKILNFLLFVPKFSHIFSEFCWNFPKC